MGKRSGTKARMVSKEEKKRHRSGWRPKTKRRRNGTDVGVQNLGRILFAEGGGGVGGASVTKRFVSLFYD